MYVYVAVLLLILVNGLLFGHRRKWFVLSSFILIIGMAALRKYTVGIDLAGHYAKQYTVIANLSWSQLPAYYRVHTYNLGFIVFAKLLGAISDNSQCFIIATSVIIFGSTARYIYRHSDNVVLETFMFVTSFTMMMYMNIIAQAMAIAIILFGLDLLLKKQYLRYIICVLFATTIHTSAIVCLGFIPLLSLPNKKKYVIGYVLAIGIGSIFADRIVSILINSIFSEFAVYFETGSYHGRGIDISANSLFQVSMHLMALFIAFLYLYKKEIVKDSKLILYAKKKKPVWAQKRTVYKIGQLPTNFLVYMSVTACVFRIIVYQSYIFSRMGFYFYFFSFSLLARGVSNIENRSNKRIILCFIYSYMLIMFLAFYKSAGTNSYGVLPYVLFWN